ncbi:Anion-transporting ATPase, ArsA/GET3 family [Quadrisphaera granulorum]|uniref:Anion-transporting ArsA/GET3 family ATPase n=1 Tax=Quadrisphaera granulorum TaxID=317664 RepID=A0A316A615_9ACTN|nr:ArsA-related P-loop ATPase [Quadrisphaera granulorum]PWJ53356.1 anion-transporting ArsA/GET3 family ATPase [Quadrisphaera granulorum]SZE97030.1 Anion-transporting ATPase, ArsA/GET3 family [Quadrisphaera granulorum]
MIAGTQARGATPRLHVVTGKGGTGKTTLAVALALSLADEGRRVLVCEVEGRQGVSRLLGTEALPYEEVDLAEGAGGGQVVGLAVEPRAALVDYLDTFHGGVLGGRGGRASTVLDRAGAVEFIADVAPGLRDVLLVGKVYEAVRRTTTGRSDGGTPVYDAVVLDAPPTGRITRFLGIGDELAQLAAGGPIAARAASVAALLRSEQTAVHLVCLPEELPVTETLEAAAELRAADLPLGSVVVNRVLSAAAGDDDGGTPASVRAALLRGLGSARDGAQDGAQPGQDDVEALVTDLLTQNRVRAGRVGEQRRWLEAARAAGRPVRELPDLPGGVDLDGLYRLADDLAATPLPTPGDVPTSAGGVA